MVMEAKATAEEDPFLKRGQKHADTVIQLSVSARNLLFIHGFLATFTLGIYGDVARIARFDRTCAIVSQPFNYRERPDVLRRFLWRFVHPFYGNVVGCDPAVQPLTTHDVQWVKEQLKALEWDTSDLSENEMLKGRKVSVPEGDDIDAPRKNYVLFDLLNVNARLFSRSTMVWLCLEDHRDGDKTQQPKLIVLKEAWHQIVRRPETEFYERLKEIPDDKRVGLAHMLCGADYGLQEVNLWRASGGRLPRYGFGGTDPGSETEPSAPAATLTLPEGESVAGKFPVNELLHFLTPPFSDNVDMLSDAETTAAKASTSSSEYLLPYPQYQTHSWRLMFGDMFKHRERSLVRIVLDAVGRPLSRFRSTREMAMAFRDAIAGESSSGTVIILYNVSVQQVTSRRGRLGSCTKT